MTELIAVCAVVVAVAAGIRSTWSPCGISMLSTITPIAERGRGHRWSTTATWYLVGGVVGGATLGATLAALAAGFRAMVGGVPLSTSTESVLVVVAAALSLIAAAADAGIVTLPVHHRQVNERWLDTYRPWVYATGFGWQIGTGLATYIRTSAVYLLIALATLGGNPVLALSVGLVFGLVRGAAVFASKGITSSDALATFHRRFAEWGRTSRVGIVVVELGVAAALACAASPWAAAVLVLALVTCAAVTTSRHRRHTSATAATSPDGSRTTRTA